MATRFLIGGALLGLLLSFGPTEPTQAATIIFKDGYVVSGKVRQPHDFIIDPVGGAQIRIPAGFFYVDDEVRRILFSPAQVQDVSKEDPPGKNDQIRLQRYRPRLAGYNSLPSWSIEGITPWDSKWQRVVKLTTDRGRLDIDQRLTLLTPTYLRIDSLRYEWSPRYMLPEWGPDQVRGLLDLYYQDKKELKDPEKRLLIVRFLLQAGWLDHAQKELDKLLQEHPEQKSATITLQETLTKLSASMVVEAARRAPKVGQHAAALDKLGRLAKVELAPHLEERQLVAVQELKNKYEEARNKLKQVETYLKGLPDKISAAQQPIFGDAAQVIAKELNLDTLHRLETFLVFAQQFDRDVKEDKKPSQSADEVLALAISGWVQGDTAAATDVARAQLLWQVRELALEYHKDGDNGKRGLALKELFQDKEVTIDVLARVVGLLPPPVPFKKISTDVTQVEIDLPQGGVGGTYLVKLPPEYHHNRPYPVLLLLHGARERPELMLARWSTLAAQHGYILAAPMWGSGFRPSYKYTNQEHALVLDCLRDLRRRFQVDSNRVFLFGWEQGADMAYDIGLSHPDQFAGVLPMNGNPKYFAQRYWSNGQYLPFYVVEGDMNGGNPKANRTLFKDWIRWNYPAMYLEYKGRGSEWFEGELPLMMEWMNRKKRAHPLRQLGRYHTGGLATGGEEFKSMRHGDNRFYWLSTDAINDRCINSVQDWNPRCPPATLQASIYTGNQLETKAGGGVKGANIWSQINVRTSGVKQVSIWLGANQIDFSKPLLLRINGQQYGKTAPVTPNWQILLEDLYLQGDRQRLYFARIDVKL